MCAPEFTIKLSLSQFLQMSHIHPAKGIKALYTLIMGLFFFLRKLTCKDKAFYVYTPPVHTFCKRAMYISQKSPMHLAKEPYNLYT